MQHEQLKVVLLDALKNTHIEFQRLFHGRGGCYKGLEYLTVDSIDKILYVCLYEQTPSETVLLNMLIQIFEQSKSHEILLVQRRYEKKTSYEVLKGELPLQPLLIQNQLKYAIHFHNQNLGFFADMKHGHEYVQTHAKDKTVLNLFSYTCAFSVCAIEGGALKTVNVDMAKNALSIGRTNHRLNHHDTKKVHFMPYNILKSWSRIKKQGPYDMIIIDPPSFQKGSFAATKDYEKVIKRLEDLASDECTVLCALNDPKLDTHFMKALFFKHAPKFVFEQRLKNPDTFPSENEEAGLKSLIFKCKAL